MTGLAVTVMCETRDLVVKWPHWHTLIFSDETRIDMRCVCPRDIQKMLKIDMRFVCPKDIRKMLVQRARSVSWKKWAAKHEHEELKEGAWLEPALALLRKKVREDWTERHRNVARKIFLEGGWTQKRLFDVGWSDVSQCQACHMEEGTEKHRLYHCPEWNEIRREILEPFRKWEQKARTSKKEWKWQRGIVADPLSESQRNRGLLSVKKWES